MNKKETKNMEFTYNGKRFTPWRKWYKGETEIPTEEARMRLWKFCDLRFEENYNYEEFMKASTDPTADLYFMAGSRTPVMPGWDSVYRVIMDGDRLRY